MDSQQQKRNLIIWSFFIAASAVIYLLYSGISLSKDREYAENDWTKHLEEADELPESYAGSQGQAGVLVEASTYINSIDDINIKQSEFSVTFDVLFSWDRTENPEFDMYDGFRIYNGKITEKSRVTEYDRDGKHYQLLHVSAEVKQVFSTKRFPLSSYQLRFYLQPVQDMSHIHMRAMDKHSAGADKQLNVSGFSFERMDIANYYYEVPKPERYGWYSERSRLYILNCSLVLN